VKIRIGHVLAALLIVLPAARAAAADAGDSAITAALIRFVDALESGDAIALEQLISAETATQERSRKTFVDLAASQKALERAAVKKFGEEGKRFRCGFDLIVNAPDRKIIAGAKVIYDDPTRVHIEKSGELAPMSLRRSPEGQWQVILQEPIESEEEEIHYPFPYQQPGMSRFAVLAGIRAAHYNAIIEAFKQTQARIDNGDLPTAAAAQAELLAKLTAAAADAAKARAALPSGRIKERP